MTASMTTRERNRLRELVARRDGSSCHYCSQLLVGSERTLDHIWPRARGRIDAVWNLVIACASCNAARGHDGPACPCAHCRRAIATARLVLALGEAARGRGIPVPALRFPAQRRAALARRRPAAA